MSDQPMPHGGRENVTEIARTQFTVMLDEQEAKGIAKYGMSLATHNGRDAHYDALAELVDAFQYVTQAMLESVDLRAELEAEQHINRQLARNVLEAQAERDRYKRALEWYADEDNYGCTPWAEGLDGGTRIDQDWGERARAALAGSSDAAGGAL